MAAKSETWTWFDGDWHEGNVLVAGPQTHAFWLGSSVFDGARAFEGVTPDLDRHCARLNRSAEALSLKPTRTVEEIMGLVGDGLSGSVQKRRLHPAHVLGGGRCGRGLLRAAQSRFDALFTLLYVAPMNAPKGFSITLSPFRRPSPETMPTQAKSGCLYPNNARMVMEARSRGFDNALVLDMLGNVAEAGSSNLFMVKDGVVKTPALNGTFLAGITRARTIELLRGAGVTVEETTLGVGDFMDADEVFSSGNNSKIVPINRIDARELQPGPMMFKARQLYWDWAHAKA
ncbi:MAG: branched-chain amino acid aminotransferase [Hyphomicrobiaceae bacterium]